MRDIDFKVLKFLVDGKAYSDGAVMKNLGITLEELEESYDNLLKDGYLESYTEYLERTNKLKELERAAEEEVSCGSSCGSSCGNRCDHNCDGCSSNIPEEYYGNIKVITEKANRLF